MGKFFFIYCISIVLINIGFDKIPLIDLGFGMLSPMAVIVGGIFVLRDYVQRECGHYVLLAMAFGCVASYFLASPAVAFASLIAFGISELVDYLVYIHTKKPFYKRILMSSLVSVPIDSLLFLSLINSNTPATFVLMVASKLIAAIWIYYYVKRKDSQPAPATN